MKLVFTLFASCIFLSNVFGQTKDDILAEAYLLYHSEKASWNGSDIFLEKFPEKKELLGGYFSYTENNLHHCIFFDQSEEPNLLAKISFGEDFNINKAQIDTIPRKLSFLEMDLYTIRKLALEEIQSDTLFKWYKNTNFNVIPIITGKEKKVFVLTGPQVTGVVIFGNDYIIIFDKKNRVKSKKSLHNNIISLKYNKEIKDAISMHTHSKSTGHLITSTDICTLLLYEKYAKWKQHFVISDKNVSLWDCEKDQLLILTKKAWDRIYNHEREK